ncbi:MAG: selenium-dependent xanthine dehydrogenase, partial [Bacteroidales bacterium]|nr:selenium-dependent xanthine dehydrogenase [Bacteroidales bacterium]
MIQLQINGQSITYNGDPKKNLLKFLRNEMHLTAAKDGCSGQATCGACLVEIDGKPRLACSTPMEKLQGTQVVTLEGIPENIQKIIATTFVNRAAVQCGFCTPGFIMRTHILLKENPNPTIEEIRQAIKGHLCRCTGYKKIEIAIADSAQQISGIKPAELLMDTGRIGVSSPKYQALETAIGKRKFINDMHPQGMLFGALCFSEHPRAKVITIDTTKARTMPGVKAVFLAKDIPGDRLIGLIFKDWPMMIDEGETTNYIGDVLAGVVAETEEQAREAVASIKVTYQVLQPVTDTEEAIKESSPRVHPNKSNLLETCVLQKGNPKGELQKAAFKVNGIYTTQRIEHAFLETESALALWENEGITLYSGSQGIYEDRVQVAQVLNLAEDKVRVILVPNGGGFGGKEDLSVQGHTALFAYHLKQPVKVTLTREESFRMHPKRHPVKIDITLACDKHGKLTAMKMRAIGDTGAYASVGTKVMERIAGHATGGYFVPNIDLKALTVYTNNIPCGAMRGFGANQAAFALESCVDDLCKLGGFDRWQFRYDNALVEGLTTATSDPVKGVGIRACLEKLKDKFYEHKYTGIACAIKNSGVGNGMVDFSDVIIDIISENKVILLHGWTEMGQGVHTIAAQALCEETGIDPKIVEVIVDTKAGIKTGMTTSSRGTVLLGNAIIDACKTLKIDLKNNSLKNLSGKQYRGRWECTWTTKPGESKGDAPTHYSYGYAAQLVILDDSGKIDKVYAAHDAGKIFNPKLFEGQIEGAVHMGLGYALSEEFPMENGQIVNKKLKDLKILRAHQTPQIVVIGVEVP